MPAISVHGALDDACNQTRGRHARTNGGFTFASVLTFIKLVRTWAMDFGEGFGEFGG